MFKNLIQAFKDWNSYKNDPEGLARIQERHRLYQLEFQERRKEEEKEQSGLTIEQVTFRSKLRQGVPIQYYEVRRVMRGDREEVFYRTGGYGPWDSLDSPNSVDTLVRYNPNVQFLRIPANWASAYHNK